jgi:sugar/nucleoside kinase (ribokinase family)
MNGTGVYYNTPRLREWKPTARSMILITPDGERTMNTYLGACTEFSPSDVDEDVVAAAAVTYMEGYLWDPEEAKKAFLQPQRLRTSMIAKWQSPCPTPSVLTVTG